MNSALRPTESGQARSVLVVGGGTMGSGIAENLLACGYLVTLQEISTAAAESSRQRIEAGLRRTATRLGESEPWLATRLRGLAVIDSPADVAATSAPFLIIESVPEQIDLKQGVLAELARRYPQAILATNTSALSIDVLAGAVVDASRFVGMHFFNPVPRSTLVEVVRGAHTDRASLDVVHAVAADLGKVSIEVRDFPGFATSRLGIAIGLEAMRMFEDNVASAEDIDAGMVQGYKFPIGPLALSDMVGLDVRLAIADHLHAELGERFRAPEVLRRKVAAGELGVKTRRGFYAWTDDGSRVRSDPGPTHTVATTRGTLPAQLSERSTHV